MIREIFTNIRPRRGYYLPVLVALLILVAVAGLAQSFPRGILKPSNLDRVGLAGQTVSSGVAVDTFSPGDIRSADAHSAQLALLGRWAHEVLRFGEATTYELQLEDLARQGRTAFAATHLPISANDYVYYMDRLRLLGQGVQATNIEPVDANTFSAYTEMLFREARNVPAKVSATATPNNFTNQLDSLRRLGQAAFTEQARPMDANEYVTWLEHLRIKGSETQAVDIQGRK